MSHFKRRSERIPTRLEVRWIRRPYPIALSAVDINMHGMFLETDETVLPGGLMQLEVMLPDGPVSMFVRARFIGHTVSGHGIGLEIFLMDELERSRWDAHYRRLLAVHRNSGARHEIGAAASIA
jgi:hypothetical protein